MKEKYSFEEAQEEAEKLAKKVDSGEAADYSHAELKVEYEKQKPTREKLEFEIRPEIVERILEKVQDINQPGTAFTVIGAGSKDELKYFKYVLEEGVLGNSFRGLFFNVVGKMRGLSGGMEIKRSYWFQKEASGERRVGIIFSLDNLKEIPPIRDDSEQPEGTYHPYVFNIGSDERKSFGIGKDSAELDPEKIKKNPRFEEMVKWGMVDKDGRFIPHDDDGYRMPSAGFDRVELKGIVIKPETIYFNDIRTEKTIIDVLREVINELIKNYDERSSKLLLPIYDTNGNLLWPKQMSYQEVKDFVAERDAGDENTRSPKEES